MASNSQSDENGQLATTTDTSATEPDQNGPTGLIYRAVYGFGYYLSFGIMFPTLLVVRAIPLDNALGHGLCDGTLAAKDSSAAAHASMRRGAEAVSNKVSDMYAGVARKVQERVEVVQDSLAERRHRKQIAAAPTAVS